MLTVLLFTKCTGTGLDDTTEKNIAENIVTLKFSIGESSLPDEFLIAQPKKLIVDEKNRVLVFDERKIKVFDENGEPLKIVGGPGEGPGEFGPYMRNLSISSSGYLLTRESSSYSLFSPDYEFIDKRLFTGGLPFFETLKNRYNLEQGSIEDMRLFNESEFIIYAEDINPFTYNDEGNYHHFLFYVKENDVREIVVYKMVNTVTFRTKNSFSSSSYGYLGKLYYSILPDDRIIYTHTGWDSEIRDGEGYLTWHIVNKDGSGEKLFEWRYTPELIEESFIDDITFGNSENARLGQFEKRVKDMLREKRYKAPVSGILTDRNFLFIESFRIADKKTVYDFDVIDTDTGDYLNSFTIDFMAHQIQNGFIYRLFPGNKNEFARIDVYKIDPKVYH